VRTRALSLHCSNVGAGFYLTIDLIPLLYVVRAAGQTDEEIARKVERAVKSNGPMTAVDLSSLWSISLPLAKEHLIVRKRACPLSLNFWT
jgi:ABC-type sulfate transport system permease component